MVHSAYEDLQRRTLDKIRGMLEQLVYLAEQRSSSGLYQHWGFERTHGTATAQTTFTRAHQSLIGTILRTKMRSLREDLAQTSAAAETSPVSYVSKLTASPGQLLPVNCPKMTGSHLISVLQTLSILESHSRTRSRSS